MYKGETKMKKPKWSAMVLGFIAQLVTANSSETVGLGIIVYFLIQIYFHLVEE